MGSVKQPGQALLFGLALLSAVLTFHVGPDQRGEAPQGTRRGQGRRRAGQADPHGNPRSDAPLRLGKLVIMPSGVEKADSPGSPARATTEPPSRLCTPAGVPSLRKRRPVAVRYPFRLVGTTTMQG